MLEDQLVAYDPAFNNADLPSFLRMGSWIGGDRDGNPFVNAEVLAQTMSLQSKRVVDFYLDELHLLGAELSLDRARVSISAQLQELADRSPDPSPRRAAEPYRRAIVGIYARLVATARALGQTVLPRHCRHHGGALRAMPRSCAPISTCSTARCTPTARRCSRAAGCARCAAPSRCSASIWRASTCGRTPTCTSASWPSWLPPARAHDYRAMDESGARRLPVAGARHGAARWCRRS